MDLDIFIIAGTNANIKVHSSQCEYKSFIEQKVFRKFIISKQNYKLQPLHRSYSSKSPITNSITDDHQKTEKALFSLYMNPSTEKINMGHFLLALEKTGIRRTDPRLKELIDDLEELHDKIGEEGTTPENIDLSFDAFQRLIDKTLVLVSQAFSQKLVVPDFPDFCTQLKDIYRRCRSNNKV